MNSLLQDIRYGFRMLAKSPGFTVVAVLILAVGIGANTAIFSVANEVLLRPRPGIGHPSELVDIGRTQNGRGFDNFSYPNYVDYRNRSTSFSGMLGYMIEPHAVSLSDGDSAEKIYSGVVSGNYFSVLEVRPTLGRFFSPDEDRTPGTHPVTVLSHAFWTRRFHADPGVIGREIKINGQAFSVIGVAAKEFRGTMVLAPDAWFPMNMIGVVRPGSNLLASRAAVWMVSIGRLKPGVSMQQAQAEMTSIAQSLEKEFPGDNSGKGVVVMPSALFPGEMRQMIAAFIGLLMTLVALVLLIACVNVAGMMLVRASARRREIAVRLAIGAGRGQIARQILTEGIMLFLMGGTAGLLVAVWIRDVLLAAIPNLPVPIKVDLSLDWRVMTFTAIAAMLTGTLSSLAPAWQAAKSELVTALKDDPSGGAPRKQRLRNALVLGQVAASLVLLVCAGLFMRALGRATQINPGFEIQNLDVLSLDLSLAGYSEEDGAALAGRLLERVHALPGVEGASLSWGVPLDGNGRGLGGVEVTGFQTPRGGSVWNADWNIVTPEYFRTMKIPLVSGREFTEADAQGSAEVCIINETMAKKFWPGQNAVGRKFNNPQSRNQARILEIVGVARDQKYRSLGDEPRLFVFAPLKQNYMASLFLVVRSAAGHSQIPTLRAVVRELNPYLPVLHAESMEEVAGIGLLPQRIAGGVAGGFGAVGLLLTAIGIYGVTAFSVSQRTREIGIRMALGAQSGDVMSIVLSQGMKLTLVGVGIGLVLAFAATRLLDSLLFGLSAQDPFTFAGVAILMCAATLAACWIPARRAAAVNPIVALRYE
ncbi:MAG: ABC transporter permease [Acidobacteria bacterium]|nr:ABC transporter permease [Acidobacteriota bacterium]